VFRRETLKEHTLSDARINGPRVLSAATAVSPHRVKQQDPKGFARCPCVGKLWDLGRLLLTFDNARIETRHLCRPLKWFGREWPFPSRMPYMRSMPRSSRGGSLFRY
jgi:hypothetical protein